MKTLVPFFLSVAVLGIVLGVGAHYVVKAQRQDQKIAQGPAIEATYRRLPTGALVYEERPVNGAIQDIAPAAGDAEAPDVRYKYDPLTQTYRAQRVDSQGNTRQDIIADPLHP